MKYLFFVFISIFAAANIYAESKPVDGNKLVKVSITAFDEAVSANSLFYLAAEITPENGWHTYWINPGDAGLPTAFEFDLPKGFELIETKWQTPHSFPYDEFVNYGYSKLHYVLFTFKSPKIINEKEINIKIKADWLVCKDVCLPGSKELAINLKVSSSKIQRNKTQQSLFDSISSLMPVSADNSELRAQIDNDELKTELQMTDLMQDVFAVDVFPIEEGFFNYKEIQTVIDPNTIEIKIKLDKMRSADPKSFKALLVYKYKDKDKKNKSIMIDIPIK